LAHLRLALAKMLSEDDLIICGFAGQLIPRNIHHVLRVCLIADMNSRIAAAAREHQIAQPEALKIIHRKMRSVPHGCIIYLAPKIRGMPPSMISPFRPTKHRRMKLPKQLKKHRHLRHQTRRSIQKGCR
jgi:hypothetical protein